LALLCAGGDADRALECEVARAEGDRRGAFLGRVDLSAGYFDHVSSAG